MLTVSNMLIFVLVLQAASGRRHLLQSAQSVQTTLQIDTHSSSRVTDIYQQVPNLVNGGQLQVGTWIFSWAFHQQARFRNVSAGLPALLMLRKMLNKKEHHNALFVLNGKSACVMGHTILSKRLQTRCNGSTIC